MESINKSFWKNLWQLKLSNKMKTFAWRACRDSLPTFINLKKKHVMVEDRCVFCLQQVKDPAHALFYCIEIRQHWTVYLPELQNIGHNLSLWDWANVVKDT